MDGRESSLSLQGEAYPRPVSASRKTYKYKVISRTSSVDETLFGSHRDKRADSRQTSDGGLTSHKTDDRIERTSSPKVKSSLTATPKTKKDFRVSKKASPSFVDETLFGNRKLSMPDFEPPWAEKKDPRFEGRPLVWSPPVAGSLSDTPRSRPSSAQGHRSSSRLDSSRSSTSMGSRPNSAMNSRGTRGQTVVKPPWR